MEAMDHTGGKKKTYRRSKSGENQEKKTNVLFFSSFDVEMNVARRDQEGGRKIVTGFRHNLQNGKKKKKRNYEKIK